MELTAFRNEFPVLSDYTYLNTASSGILSSSVCKWRQQHDDEYLQKGSLFRDNYLDLLQGVKKTIGNVFSCNTDNIGLVPNFSWAMNALVEGLQECRKVMVVTGEYPSITEPLKSRDLDMITIPRNNLSAEYLLHQIGKFRPDIFAISLVQWNDGAIIAPETIMEIRENYPDLLLIGDGTQYLGTAPFDFDQSGLDVIISSGYKWMLSGYGNGVIMLSPQIMDKLKLKTIGNNTLMERMLTGRSNEGQLWQPGHLDTLSFGTMQKSLQILQKVGLSNIQKQIQKLALTLKTKLVNAGYLPAQHLGGKYHGGIVLIPGIREMVVRLQSEGIVVSYRDGIRISFHAYNTKDEVNRIAEALRLMIG